MAVTTTNFDPPGIPFPYSGLDTLGGDESPHPFTELRFNVLAGAVPVEAGGNTQRADITVTLPRNFAYTLMDIHYSMTGADGADWDAGVDCWFTDGTSSTGPANLRTFIAIIPAWSEQIAGNLRAFRFDTTKMGVIIPGSPDSTPQFRTIHQNLNINGSLMTVQFHMRVLQFNLEQAYYFAVNSPTPTR